MVGVSAVDCCFSSLLVLFGYSVGWLLSNLIGLVVLDICGFAVVFTMCFSFFSFEVLLELPVSANLIVGGVVCVCLDWLVW